MLMAWMGSEVWDMSHQRRVVESMPPLRRIAEVICFWLWWLVLSVWCVPGWLFAISGEL